MPENSVRRSVSVSDEEEPMKPFAVLRRRTRRLRRKPDVPRRRAAISLASEKLRKRSDTSNLTLRPLMVSPSHQSPRRRSPARSMMSDASVIDHHIVRRSIPRQAQCTRHPFPWNTRIRPTLHSTTSRPLEVKAHMLLDTWFNLPPLHLPQSALLSLLRLMMTMPVDHQPNLDADPPARRLTSLRLSTILLRLLLLPLVLICKSQPQLLAHLPHLLPDGRILCPMRVTVATSQASLELKPSVARILSPIPAAVVAQGCKLRSLRVMKRMSMNVIAANGSVNLTVAARSTALLSRVANM
jgi:hypothetical protein